MLLLQLVAARLAGIDYVVFHTVTAEHTKAYKDAMAQYQKWTTAGTPVSELIQQVGLAKYKWGVGNGT